MRPAISRLLLVSIFAAGPLSAEHGGPALGAVSFPIACRAELQPAFERAVAYLHSFGYEEAREGFLRVAAEDPACAMASWGVAMSYYHPLWAAPTPDELRAGRRAAEEAASRLPAPGATSDRVADARERAFVGAIGSFYADADDHRTRATRYRDAMAALAANDPEDAEAVVFHALAILGAAPPADPTRAEPRRAAELLRPLVPRLPQHPGVAHYLIHALDSPELAAQGLDAARRYARIAPASPHALHMPSHIFIRLGLWAEAIASNLDSEASSRAIADRYPASAAFETLHALDYQVYAYLQGQQYDEAMTALGEAAELVDAVADPPVAFAYGLAAIPARIALERGDWAGAAALPLSLRKGGRIDPAVEKRYAYIAAIPWFARALGAARSGELAVAESALAEVAARQARLAAEPVPGPYDWGNHVEAQRLTATAWIERARGSNDEALATMRRAADLEERVGKHPVTPGSVLPARELLGDLYLELERPREALVEYEASLLQTPNRLRSLAGARRAAELAGEVERARTYGNLVSALTAGKSGS